MHKKTSSVVTDSTVKTVEETKSKVATKAAEKGADKKNECNVIKIIKKEWEKEVERLDNKKQAGGKQTKQSNQQHEKSLVQSGHAEIEANKILYIYGNALEVLNNADFQKTVE